jgi:hypothetical protein
MSETTRRFQCRHIFTDGHRCGSACLRHEEFCYYHHTTRRPVENPRRRRSREAQFDLPLPEDRSAIQSSIGEVLRRIASNEIDSKRAGLLLYGLQIASLNLPRAITLTRPATRSRYTGRSRHVEESPETTLVEEIVIDPELGTLAPRAEFTEAEERLSAVALLLKDIERQDRQDRQDREEQERLRQNEEAKMRSSDTLDTPALKDAAEAPQNPNQADTILPTLQAAEAPKQPAEAPKNLTSRQHTRLCRRAKPSPSKKSAKKLTRTPGIAIVRGFREYPGRAVRET